MRTDLSADLLVSKNTNMAADPDQAQLVSGKPMTPPFGDESFDMNGELVRTDTNILKLDGDDGSFSEGSCFSSDRTINEVELEGQGAPASQSQGLGADSERKVSCHCSLLCHHRAILDTRASKHLSFVTTCYLIIIYIHSYLISIYVM